MTTTTSADVGTWTPVTDLPTAPTAWTGQHDGAVALEDGTVLVAGGADAAGGSRDTTAVLDPATGQWLTTGALHARRRLHTLTRLPDGKVLAAGGLGDSATAGLPSAELYDPKTRQWTATGALTTGRWGHSAALLPDGSVLVAGGSAHRAEGSTTALRSAERYDPDDGRWHDVAAMTDARTGHTAVPLAGGLVLVVGGSAPVGAGVDPALGFCELYDPAHDRWTPTGSLLRARRHHQATRVSDTTVLVTGGTAPGSPGTAPYDPFSQRTAELFDLGTGRWTARAEMPSGRAFHRAVLLAPGRVLVVGGGAGDRDDAGYRSAFVHDVAADGWTAVGGLTTGRWAFAAVAVDQQVVVTGGVVRSGLAAADPDSAELTAATEVFAADGGVS